MVNMFTHLHYDIFPVLGEFFGKLSAFASLTIGELYNVFSATVGYASTTYTNFYTGDTGTLTIVSFGQVLNVVSNIVTRILFAGQPITTPLWVALLIAFVEIFLLASFVKFVKDFISLV